MSHMKNRDSNRPRREQRQAEAKVRQEMHSKLTTAQKLEKLDRYNLVATKERAKLARPTEPKKGKK